MNGLVRVVVVGEDWMVGRAVQRTLESAGYTVSDVVVCTDEALAAAAGDGPVTAYAGAGSGGGDRALESAGGVDPAGGAGTRHASGRIGQPTPPGAPALRPAGYVITPIREGQLLSAVATGAAHTHPAAETAPPPETPGSPAAGATPAAERATGPAGATDAGQDDPRRRVPDVASAVARHARARGGPGVLTAREDEVVRLLLSNGRVRSIAEHLAISPHTVRNHLRSVFRKLGVHSQVELIRTLTAHMTG